MYLGLVAIITAAGYAMKPTTPAVTDSPLARDSTSMPPGDEADAPLVPRVQQAPVRPGPGGALCAPTADRRRARTAIPKVTSWLLAQQDPAGCWADKWHSSQY